MTANNDNSKNTQKILLVEDEESVAKLMLYSFKKAGYQYEWAENGLEGYLLAKSFQPDIIVSDILSELLLTLIWEDWKEYEILATEVLVSPD